MADTNHTRRHPTGVWMIVAIIVVSLTVLAVWKVISHRSQPSSAVFTPTPERLDALRYLTEAKTSGNTVNDDYVKTVMLARIAAVHVKAGDLPGAKGLAYAMTKEFQPLALSVIVAAQAEKDDFVGAKATIKEIKSGGTFTSEALLALATAQAKGGDIAGAKATAKSIKGEVAKDQALCAIAVAQAKASDVAGAKATANGISKEHFHASPLSDIVIAQLKAGDRAGASKSFDDAEALAKASKEDHKDVILGHIACAEAKAGELTRAKATANAITSFVKEGVMRDLAGIQAREGDIAGARAIANALRENYAKARALGDVALAQARAGDQAGASQTFDEAKTVANAETTELNKDAALCYIASRQAKAGDVAGAKATVDTTKDREIEDLMLDASSKPFTLGAIAAVQARVEGLSAAESWVETVSEPVARMFCYIALAEARLNPKGTESNDSEDED